MAVSFGSSTSVDGAKSLLQKLLTIIAYASLIEVRSYTVKKDTMPEDLMS